MVRVECGPRPRMGFGHCSIGRGAGNLEGRVETPSESPEAASARCCRLQIEGLCECAGSCSLPLGRRLAVSFVAAPRSSGCDGMRADHSARSMEWERLHRS